MKWYEIIILIIVIPIGIYIVSKVYKFRKSFSIWINKIKLVCFKTLYSELIRNFILFTIIESVLLCEYYKITISFFF